MNAAPDSNIVAQRWEEIYNQTPLCHVPSHYAGIQNSPFLLHYLTQVLRLCPRGGRTLETGIGSGYGAIWLSKRGCQAEGIDYSPAIIERARQVSNILGGDATFRTGDLFDFYDSFRQQNQPRYQVIHHQGVLEHFTVPQIQAALAQQVAGAHWVVFSVPSVNYPFEPEFGDERLLPLEEWQRILSPFAVEELKYYGDPNLGAKEQILAVLRGQPVDDALLSLMQPGQEPYPDGISAIVHTKNEARHIGPCLETLQGWTDEIIICDMESRDETLAIAGQFTGNILSHPQIANFDRARNVSAMRARYRWVFYLDADERVPEALGRQLRSLVIGNPSAGDPPLDTSFEGLLIPFRHHFAGQWMQSLYPGYTAPRLLKNGQFVFNARLHSGAQVDGRVICFPADNPDLALVHYSFDSLAHYLDKLNRYTDGEALNLHRDGQCFHWQRAVQHFVQDFQSYYDPERGQAGRDGVHGLLYSFLSGFYRFEQHAKLYERRAQAGQLQGFEREVPQSVEQVLEYALSVARHKPVPVPASIRVDDAGAEVVWSGPLRDPSGYGEESRHLLRALTTAQAETPGKDRGVAAQVLPWSHDEVDLSGEERTWLDALAQSSARPGFTHVIHNFAPSFSRHPQAGISIGRTMFETDRLPASWVAACNRMDYVWVPSAFNRETFALSGVEAKKLVVMPECIDPALYSGSRLRTSWSDAPAVVQEIARLSGTTFLSVFDWTLHKGWDVLLASFLTAFEGRTDVHLVLKVWSTNGHFQADILRQASDFCRDVLGHDLLSDTRVRFVFERLSRAGLRDLYRASDCYVLPSRGEGWGRPYMEAMACGLPTIATNWSGNTAFMTPETSCLLKYELTDVPEGGWREVPTYRGHRWAEPDRTELSHVLRRVAEDRSWAQALGARGQKDVCARFSEAVVGRQMAAELARVWEERHPHSVIASSISLNAEPVISKPTKATTTKTATRKSKHQASVADSKTDISTQSPVMVRWEGAQFLWHSLGHVNRELCLGLLEPGLGLLEANLGLLETGQVQLSLVPTEPSQFTPEDQARFAPLAERFFAPLPGPANVHVRHFFPPRFDAPAEGHLVLMQPWEYGYLPAPWIQPIEEHVTEVWCNSRAVRDVYLRSGIAEQKLHMVPLGVDAETFSPQAPPFVFTEEPGAEKLREKKAKEKKAKGIAAKEKQDKKTEPYKTEPYKKTEPFVFLFVGGTLHRKGIDILLDAYVRAFSAFDDVVLIIKDVCTRTVYRGQNEQERILSLAADTTRPPIVYLEEDLSGPQLAGVYTAADCLVQPYRGEGFCLPVLEAMSCGVPVIVPLGGPTDDFVDEEVGWRVAADKKPFGEGRIGEWECVGPTWMLEVNPDDLARLMREVYGQREEAARRGAAAAERVRAGWTWAHSTQAVLGRLQALQQMPLAVEKSDSVGDVPRDLAKSEAGEGLPAEDSQAASSDPIVSDAATSEPVAFLEPAYLEPAYVEPAYIVTDRRRSATPQPATPYLATPQPITKAKTSVNGKSKAVADSTQPDTTQGAVRKQTISLCMIARDEERVLGDCLASIQPFVDEIILVDTGSADKTMEIAKSFGARLFHFPWCDDFSAARNQSLAHATGDWILWMDADDTITAECGQKLRDLVLLAEDTVTGLLMQVHIPPAPGEVGFTIVDHVKLFRNHLGLRFEGRIHEQILEPIYRQGGQVQRSDLYVVHSGYDYTPEGQTKKRARDLTLLEKDLSERPAHPFVLFNIGMTAFHLKEYDKAREALLRCLSLSKPQESTVRKVYAMLAGCDLDQGNGPGAREWAERGLALFPSDPELLFRAGIIYREVGDLAAAEASYVKLLTAREVGHIDSLDVSMTGFKAHHNLALIYQDQEKWAEAEVQWRAAIEKEPGFEPSRLGLAELYRHQGR